MSLPIVSPFPEDGDPNFNALAHECMDSLRAFSQSAGAELTNLSSAVSSVNAGLSAASWVSGATYAVGDRAYSLANGLLYRRLTAGAGTTDPASDSVNWVLQTLPAPPLVVVSGPLQTGVPGVHHEMQNAGAVDYTLPLSPSIGLAVWLGVTNGLTNSNWVRRNGQLIMGVDEDMLIDVPYFACMFRFVGGSVGWRVYT